MHPPLSYSSMTRLAFAASLGLLAIASPLSRVATALPTEPGAALHSAARSEDDRGSGRLSRLPTLAGMLSFRGSGRIDPQEPSFDENRYDTFAYRGSGRIVEPETVV